MAGQNPSTTAQPEMLYTPAGFYLLRAPALSAQIFHQLSTVGQICQKTAQEDLDRALQESQNACSQALQELVVQPQIAQALALASPSLYKGLERLQRGEGSFVQQKRVVAGLLRYLIRMSTRPTPFGLFSGVALGRFASETRVHLASPAIARFRTRPDMQWLLAFVQRLEEDRTLVAQLNVRLNQMAYIVGERVMLPLADTYGEQDTRAISLRATPVIRRVFEIAQQYISYEEFQAALQQTFPQASPEKIEHLFWQLWENRLLISQLHPPLAHAQPAEYVYDILDSLHGADEAKKQLACVLEQVADLDHAGVGSPVSKFVALENSLRTVVPENATGSLPLQIDAALQIKSPTLHPLIGQAGAQVATFLLRNTSLPSGFRHLQEYRQLFLEKYGEQAEVPLLELLSPEGGLDAPPGYQCPARTYDRPSLFPPPGTGPRDQLLQLLLSEAISRGSLEIELTEEVQRQLEHWSPKPEEAPLSLEIYLQVHAQSREAIDRGEWTAVVGSNCGSSSAGRTFGRFFDLLGEQGMEHLRELVAHEEALLPGVIFAELSYQPWGARLANVATRPPLRSYEIAIGTTPSVSPEHVLTLSDLVVGMQNHRFYVRSLRLGKQVRVCQSHMLNTLLAPNVCRFLLEIANDGLPVLSSFDWGTLAGALFLPRLVLKTGSSARVVISPMCWHLQAGTIPLLGEGSEETRWFRGLCAFREHWQIPRYVYLTQGDNRLLLDLENPLMTIELRDEVKKLKAETQLTLEEVLPDFEHLWLRDARGAGYFSEVVVPLLRAEAVDSTASSVPQQRGNMSSRPQILSVERKCFPGEEWVYLKLYAAFSQHEELLAGPIREIVQELQKHGLLDRWFFIRYADPEPHLRLRFHTQEGQDCWRILALVLPWSTQLARRGQLQRVALDTYEREVERYGGSDAINLLEQVFTVDSALTSNLIAQQYTRHLTLDPLTVAVFTLDRLFAAWGWTFQQRLDWTQLASEKYTWSKEFRPERNRYCDLLSPRGELNPELAEQRALLLELVRPSEASLGKLGAQVRQLAQGEKLWVSERSLLSSLAHMHLNRLLGIDRNREKQVYAFWRHTLDSLQRRPDRSLSPAS